MQPQGRSRARLNVRGYNGRSRATPLKVQSAFSASKGQSGSRAEHVENICVVWVGEKSRAADQLVCPINELRNVCCHLLVGQRRSPKRSSCSTVKTQPKCPNNPSK